MLTVIRTSSDPARASSMHCWVVALTSAVSVFAMDWTATGAPPPTMTLPTGTPTVEWRLLEFMDGPIYQMGQPRRGRARGYLVCFPQLDARRRHASGPLRDPVASRRRGHGGGLQGE